MSEKRLPVGPFEDWELRYEPGRVRKEIQAALTVVAETYLQHFPTTCCRVVAEYAGRSYTRLAVVKLHPPDVWDPQTGREIALNKCTMSIADAVLKSLRKGQLGNRK